MKCKLRAPKSEQDIVSNWLYTDRVYISIVCLTYNHANYISDAIEGFLAQKTDYKFEVIIHDDASTDSTDLKIEEYRRKYPNIIKVLLNNENQYSKNVNLPIINCNKVIGGQYIAFCEGDDYWIDKNKIQNQLSFLIMNQDVGLSITDYCNLYQNEGVYNDCMLSKNKNLVSLRLNFDYFIVNQGYYAPMSWVMKRSLWLEVTTYTDAFLDSTFVWLLKVMKQSRVHVDFRCTCVHRILQESASHSNVARKIYKRNLSLYETKRYFIKYYDLDLKLNDDILYVFFIKNVSSLALKDVDISLVRSVMSDFKYIYLKRMKLKDILNLIVFLTPLSSSIKIKVRKLCRMVL